MAALINLPDNCTTKWVQCVCLRYFRLSTPHLVDKYLVRPCPGLEPAQPRYFHPTEILCGDENRTFVLEFPICEVFCNVEHLPSLVYCATRSSGAIHQLDEKEFFSFHFVLKIFLFNLHRRIDRIALLAS